MLLFNSTRWRIVIISLVVVVNFTSVRRVSAEECSGWDILTAGISCAFKLGIKRIGKSAGRGIAQGIKPDFEKMIDDAGQKLADHITHSVDWEKFGQQLGKNASQEVLTALNSINWEQYGQQAAKGIRIEFEAAMDKLFENQIKPILEDVELIIEQADKAAKDRITQADQAAEARIKQLDDLVENKLKKIDALLQQTVIRFQAAADETIAKVRTDLINYAVDQFTTERDKTVAQIRAEVIDYAATTVNNTITEIVAKVNAELIDHAFAQLEQLRQNFRRDVNQFFDQAENLLILLECTEEKTRIDMENLIKKFGKEFSANCPPLLCGLSNKAADDPILLACYKKLHLSRPPKSWQYLVIYRLEKCEVLSRLTPDMPIENIEEVYLDLHNWAKRIACIQGSTEVMWDALEFKSRYQYWSSFP